MCQAIFSQGRAAAAGPGGEQRRLDSNAMTESPASGVAAKLAAGLDDLQPLLDRHGFTRVEEEGAGRGSGGPFASATFAKADRRLHLWLRGDSLSVAYRMGNQDLDHAQYMRELLGPRGQNRFPAFAGDVRESFAALRHDLERFCGDFLDGDGDEFRRCAAAVEDDKRLTGAQRLARIEQQLRPD